MRVARARKRARNLETFSAISEHLSRAWGRDRLAQSDFQA